jgi:hopanoid-associated phosphorylase
MQTKTKTPHYSVEEPKIALLGIVVALPEELQTLSLKKIPPSALNSVLVICSGAGAENARKATETLILNGATRLISWGCAAALSPELKSGDLTLASELLDANHQRIDLKSKWHQHVQNELSKTLPVHTGTLLESREIVSLSSEKKQLYTATKAIVLDMESVAVAKVAQENNLPFLAIRAIADPVTMDLPKAVSVAMSNKGKVLISPLLKYLLLHPSELAGLIKLGLHFSAAKKTLKHVATQLDTIINFNC